MYLFLMTGFHETVLVFFQFDWQLLIS